MYSVSSRYWKHVLDSTITHLKGVCGSSQQPWNKISQNLYRFISPAFSDLLLYCPNTGSRFLSYWSVQCCHCFIEMSHSNRNIIFYSEDGRKIHAETWSHVRTTDQHDWFSRDLRYQVTTALNILKQVNNASLMWWQKTTFQCLCK